MIDVEQHAGVCKVMRNFKLVWSRACLQQQCRRDVLAISAVVDLRV